jgi:hypothetical protein
MRSRATVYSRDKAPVSFRMAAAASATAAWIVFAMDGCAGLKLDLYVVGSP